MAVKNTNQSLSWTIQNSSDLYGIDRWGKGYFTINEKGNFGIVLTVPKTNLMI